MSSRAILLVIGDPGKTESPKIVFNYHWQNGTGLSFVPSASFFHFFPWHSTTISTSSSASYYTKYGGCDSVDGDIIGGDGDGSSGVSGGIKCGVGGGGGRSGGGSGGGT